MRNMRVVRNMLIIASPIQAQYFELTQQVILHAKGEEHRSGVFFPSLEFLPFGFLFV